jgi:hypothetical protein
MDPDESDSVKRARALTAEAISPCEEAGETVAAAHLQLGLDRIGSKGGSRLREERSPWPEITRNPKP